MRDVFRILHKPSEVTAAWPFFLHGIAELNNFHVANGGYLPEKFLKELLGIVGRPKHGVVALLETRKGKQLGFIVGLEDSVEAAQRTVLIRALYKRSEVPTAAPDLQEGFENWCRENGFSEVHLAPRKCTPAMKRFLQKKLHFRFMGVQSLFSRRIA